MKLDLEIARKILLEEASEADQFELKGEWVEIVRALGEASQKAKTMIAMLGVAILAKATDVDVDIFTLKAGKTKDSRAYSARALAQKVLAAEASRIGIDLGATGPEPLNNQPFFGKDRITRDMVVHANSQAAFDILYKALVKIDKIRRSEEARLALRCYIAARKVSKKKFRVAFDPKGLPTLAETATLFEKFIRADGENGKRAQATVAGILDCQFGPERIKVSRVNDPSRKYPGDVAVFTANSKKSIERSFEVRDKNVKPSDLRIFATRALEKGVTKIAMAALAKDQEKFDPSEELIWAARRGVRLGVFFGVSALLEQVLFWTESDGVLTGFAIERVLERAVQIEISDSGLAILQSLSSG